MSLRFIDDPSPEQWNDRILDTPGGGNMFQVWELGDIKRMSRWRPLYGEVDGVAMTIHEKDAPGFGRVWYVPKGPCVTSVEQLEPVIRGMATHATSRGVCFIKVEPEIVETSDGVAALTEAGLVKTSPVQPNVSTVLVDLSPDMDTVLANLPQKTRNMIRRAERGGVDVQPVEGTPENYHAMWKLWEQVIVDQGLAVHDEPYYTRLWRTYVDAGLGQLFFAKYEGQLVASAFATVVGKTCMYKDGASLRDRPTPGGSQLVQWRIMEWAKERGATVHDLCGVPHSSKLDDKDHKLHGIGKFKTGFNKEVTDWIGAWDLPLNPTGYKLWNKVGKKVVTKLQSRGRGDGFY